MNDGPRPARPRPDPGRRPAARPDRGEPGGWVVDRRRGDPGELHAVSAERVGRSDLRPSIELLEPTDRAVVLGRAQPVGVVDAARAAARKIALVRRVSGGGAVLVGPEESVWVDVFVPRGHRHWEEDVGRAMWWIGDTWRAALDDAGVAGPFLVWRGPMVRTPWSERVCFAGVGPGEVVRASARADRPGPKVVGICQRRTRFGALFQCAVPIRWRPEDLLDVLDVSAAERAAGEAAVAGAASALGVDLAAAAAERFVAAVQTAPPAD